MKTGKTSPLDNQFQYWDRVARGKNFTHPLDGDRFRALVPRHGAILDYGCGYGRTCNELAFLGYADVLGADSSAKMIDRGRYLFPDIRLMHLDLPDNGALPFEDLSFHTVILFAVLTCIPGDVGQRNLIGEIHRLLKPGGVLYISDYWIQTDERNQHRYHQFAGRFDAFGVFELAEGVVARHHSQEHVKRLLGRFETLELFDIEVVTMNGNHSTGFQYFGRKTD